MFQHHLAEIHALQNEMTQQLGVNVHAHEIAELLTAARRTVNSVTMEADHARRWGLNGADPSEVVARQRQAIDSVMDPLRAKVAELRQMPALARRAIGNVRRMAGDGLPLKPQTVTPEEAIIAVREAGGDVYVAHDGTIAVRGIDPDTLPSAIRLTLRVYRDTVVRLVEGSQHV